MAYRRNCDGVDMIDIHIQIPQDVYKSMLSNIQLAGGNTSGGDDPDYYGVGHYVTCAIIRLNREFVGKLADEIKENQTKDNPGDNK